MVPHPKVHPALITNAGAAFEGGKAVKGKDLTGLRFGKLTVLSPTEERVRNAIVWRCRCDCGNEILVESRRLKLGVTESCGCERSDREKARDLTGIRFGKLTVLGKSGNQAKDRNPLWLCRCDCGNMIETTKRRLVTGNSSSCGCGRTPPLKDWVGKRFGMLTVLSYVRKENGAHIWHCQCDCGNRVDVRQSNLQCGVTISCGCKRDPRKNMHFLDGTCVEMLRPEIMYKTNTSGVRGVYFNEKRNKWIAQIMFKKKCYYLGGYDTLSEAAKVRRLAEEKLFGNFLEWYEQEQIERTKCTKSNSRSDTPETTPSANDSEKSTK